MLVNKNIRFSCRQLNLCQKIIFLVNVNIIIV
jgi:hypothetical protein